ncbi:MAG: multidrug ABC transporter substrate-binding protein [Phenylobacterium sp. RIFCSPHIGHO2_01_FULL_69_31]|uniref:lipoprotein-releasing ABC transporter permease subunit n=2 Tax=unclassified Phenylobacterium TaxID=2640670 RepID=UPI0008BE5E0C|nr:lipoprotein-releasing ABC transporter permease subunit [Phenylobacterium sp. RIFCSPHIGHO2_01_FULL_69_31]OHB28052.1 MAG: multidrug ABC transporter substrate-binding protein [Phenylobacterium sp. RIFCSPHIGHO2_01_FULL_69_31]
MNQPSAVTGGRAAPFGLWERMLAGRYLRAKRHQGGVALISIISFVGIMLAVATLIIVMSVMNGFRSELLGRILGFQGHVFVTGGVLDGAERDRAAAAILKVPGVTQAAPIIEAQAIAIGPSQITGALVRGIGPKDLRETTLVSGNITQGSLKGFGEGEYGGDVIVLGERLAQQLGVRPGDAVTLISPAGGATAFGGTPLQKPYTVGATFSVGMSQYDQAYIYMPLAQAQLFFGREDTADAIEVRVSNPDQAAKLKGPIAKAVGPAAIVNDWTQRDSSFWGALKVERNVMRLILMLLVAIAAMNIISGLVMLVKNKGRDIAILRTMGAGQGSILRIFFMAGAGVGALGTAAGLIIGVLFCAYIGPIQGFVEYVTGQAVFASDVYYLSRIPAKVDWAEVALIVSWSLGMSFLATLPPSWRASRLDPVEALRYE